jgi:hypothetical protein
MNWKGFERPNPCTIPVLAGGTEEYHEESRSGRRMSLPKFEQIPDISSKCYRYLISFGMQAQIHCLFENAVQGTFGRKKDELVILDIVGL